MQAGPEPRWTLERWVHELCAELRLDPGDVDRDLVLDLARDIAHGVARPAAPLTAFLVGLAAGRDGGDATAVARAAELARRLGGGPAAAQDVTSSSPA